MNIPKISIISFSLIGLLIIAFQYSQNSKLKNKIKTYSAKEAASLNQSGL